MCQFHRVTTVIFVSNLSDCAVSYACMHGPLWPIRAPNMHRQTKPPLTNPPLTNYPHRQNPRRQYPRRENTQITEFKQKAHISVFHDFKFIYQNKLFTQYNVYVEKVELLFK